MENITNLPLHSIYESPFNPRKTFNQAALQELADSIRAQGIMSPIVVRALPNSLHYQIVFGHRRYRAAKLAELDCIPAIIRDLNDEQVKIAQLHENLEREDVSPVEEADAFDALMREHGVTAEQLIQQTGKSKSYIYGRLKLVGLCAAVREACTQGLPTDVAIKIGRIPSEALQIKALGRVQESKGKWHSVRYALSILDVDTFRVSLNTATFPLTVAGNHAEASQCISCHSCRFNSSNDPGLLEALGADVCTDTECFKTRTEAHALQVEQEHEAQGGTVLRGEEGHGVAAQANWPLQYKREAVILSKELAPGKTIAAALEEMGEAAPKLLVARARDGHAEKLLPYDALDTLREHLGLPTAGSTPPSAARADQGGAADAGQADDEDDVPAGQLALPLTPEEQAARANWPAILKAMMRAAVGRRRTVEELRLIVALVMDPYEGIPEDVAEVMGWTEELSDLDAYGEDLDWLTRKITTMTADELAAFLVVLALYEGHIAHLTFNATRVAAQVSLARSYGIDPLNPDAPSAPEATPTPPPAAQAPKGGSNGRGAAAKPKAPANASLDLGDPLPAQEGSIQAGFAGLGLEGAGSAVAPAAATDTPEGGDE